MVGYSVKKEVLRQEIKKLKLPVRNKVRAILASKEKDAIEAMNSLRKKCSVSELYQAEKVIHLLLRTDSILPELFPSKPQTKESFIRLDSMPIDRKLSYLDFVIRSNKEKLINFFELLTDINNAILARKYYDAEDLIERAILEYGYSHLLLRKIIFIMAQHKNTQFYKLNAILAKYDIRSNIANTLLYCYKEEQDYLSIKKSVMSTTDKGDFNKFTRDILRIAFHPHSKNDEDLSKLTQSCLQFSLIDAVIILKINIHNIDTSLYPNILYLSKRIEDSTSSLEEIMFLYKGYDDPEDVFFQRSSAWLEGKSIVDYRLLIDHFNDSPDADYFELTDEFVSRVSKFVKVNDISDLLKDSNVNNFGIESLYNGNAAIARSALLNYIVHINKGKIVVSENILIDLMGITRDLSRTINVSYFKNMILAAPTELSKIILFLLIIKRSENEADNFRLRRMLQNHIINNYNGDLVLFVENIAKKSQEIAKYTYDVCTEDFISKLSHIIKETEQISETRAKLHNWMGELTGDSAYLVRARNLRIDHKINMVKNELDDNRIYVDTAKFLDWMQDDIVQDLTTALSLSPHDKEEDNPNELQIIRLISTCFYEFCSNNLFGIASYLGRRLRHGTFKGHLYHAVVNVIERQYNDVVTDPIISTEWDKVKQNYEREVDLIVKDKLHIKSKNKFEGFLDPEINTQGKSEVLKACVNNIYEDFSESESSYNSILLITEYCWRLAEIDMRNVGAYLKGKKANLIDIDSLCELRKKYNAIQVDDIRLASFTRELRRLVSDQLSEMYGWFKKPQSVSPKASLNLLYKAVVTEVQQSFPTFQPDTNFNEEDDIELMGGAYHVLYDALYVIVYNAAKHGKPSANLLREFSISNDEVGSFVKVYIHSAIKDSEGEKEVNENLKVNDTDKVDDAQLYENSSGIKKLYHLQKYDPSFHILRIECIQRKVITEVIYRLVHT